MIPGESLQSLTGENTTLKHLFQQPPREHRTLQERLEVVPPYDAGHQAEDILAHVADDTGIATDGLPAGHRYAICGGIRAVDGWRTPDRIRTAKPRQVVPR
ncbi:hypothetical protein [Kitasatospora sp. NPDC058478]|uniref:hypothetical protein n=1 Tax=unclassified Kitasatospora TaxID=2633591 RepID=UPI00365A414B